MDFIHPFIHSGASVSWRHLLILITSQLWMEVNFYKPVSIYVIMSQCFPIWYCFECFSEWVDVYFRLRSFFFHVAYPFGFSVILSSFPYFAPNLFCFLIIRLLICIGAFTPYFLIEFFSLFWNVLFCFYCFILSRYLFSFHSFVSNFVIVVLCELFFISVFADVLLYIFTNPFARAGYDTRSIF